MTKKQKQQARQADLRMSTVCDAIATRYKLGKLRLPGALESAFQSGFRLARRTLLHNEALAYAALVQLVTVTLPFVDHDDVAKARMRALDLLRAAKQARDEETADPDPVESLDGEAVAEVRKAMGEDPASQESAVASGSERHGGKRCVHVSPFNGTRCVRQEHPVTEPHEHMIDEQPEAGVGELH